MLLLIELLDFNSTYMEFAVRLFSGIYRPCKLGFALKLFVDLSSIQPFANFATVVVGLDY